MDYVNLEQHGTCASPRVCLGMMSFGKHESRRVGARRSGRRADRAARGRGRRHLLRHGRRLQRRPERGRDRRACCASSSGCARSTSSRRRSTAGRCPARTAAASRGSTSWRRSTRSLERLGLDYVDLYQIHRWDDSTPIEETMEALHDVVKAGKARYIGASSMCAWQFAKAQRVRRDAVRLDAEPLQPDLPRGGAGDDPAVPRPGDRHRPVEPARARTACAQRRVVRRSGLTTRARTRSVPRLALQARARRPDHRAPRRGGGRAQASRPRRWRSRGSCTSPGVTAPIVGATKLEHLEDALAAEQLSLSRGPDRAARGAVRPAPGLGHRLLTARVVKREATVVTWLCLPAVDIWAHPKKEVFDEDARCWRTALGAAHPIRFRRIAENPCGEGPLCRTSRQLGDAPRRQVPKLELVQSPRAEDRASARPERPAWPAGTSRAHREQPGHRGQLGLPAPWEPTVPGAPGLSVPNVVVTHITSGRDFGHCGARWGLNGRISATRGRFSSSAERWVDPGRSFLQRNIHDRRGRPDAQSAYVSRPTADGRRNGNVHRLRRRGRDRRRVPSGGDLSRSLYYVHDGRDLLPG